VVAVSLVCANEPDKYATAKAKLDAYYADGWELFTPGIAVGEVLFALCRKREENKLNDVQYSKSVRRFIALMGSINPPPMGDASLIQRADEIRNSYGCSRANDAIYVALAEQLQKDRKSVVITFDAGLKTQAKARAAGVEVDVLTAVTP
jgi:predicted nucleic acid-binding protein